MKNIAIITYIRPDCSCGGIEDHNFELIKNINKNEYNVYSIFSYNKTYDFPLEELKKYCTPIMVKCNLSEQLPFLSMFKKLEFNLKLRHIIKSYNFDIIQINGDNGGLINSSNILYCAYGSTTFRKMVRYTRPIPFIKNLFGYLQSIYLEFLGLKKADQIIIDNNSIYSLVQNFNKTAAVHLIYDIINLSEFKNYGNKNEIRRTLGLSCTTTYAIWVSSSGEKGIKDAIECVADLKNTKLLIIGYKPQGIHKNAIYLGFKRRTELINYLNASDYFLLPTRKQAIDLATIEAVSCGLIPILYRSAYGFLFNNDTAFLCDNIYDMKDITKQIDKDKTILTIKQFPSFMGDFETKNVVNSYMKIYNLFK